MSARCASAVFLMLGGSASAVAAERSPFVEVSAEAGLDFVHFNGMSGEFYMPEMMGPGIGFLDYDGDGDQDLVLLQGEMLAPGDSSPEPLFPQLVPDRPGFRLYRNDGGRPVPRFVDVTAASGLAVRAYGFGVATADIDNDGWPDLYFTTLGADELWLNDGRGGFRRSAFVDSSAKPRWGASAAFADFDRDGWLDLAVTNYVRFSLAGNPRCFSKTTARDYCSPSAFEPEADRLYRNRGDGSFEDLSISSGIGGPRFPGLGVVTADFDRNGWLDLYVANDQTPNLLWLNRGDGTFTDASLLSGSAVNRFGQVEASMGLEAADFDGDGDEDLFMTHLTNETNTLFVNEGNALFVDRSAESGLGPASVLYTGFGTGVVDYDNDGRLDLFIANGAVRILEHLARQGDLLPLDEPNQLLRNLGDGRFVEVTTAAGAALATPEVSRGVAVADADNDGDQDLVVANNNARPSLLLNEVGSDGGWIGLQVLAGLSGRAALGAEVDVISADGLEQRRRVRTDGSYCSSRDPRVLVGLGEADGAGRLSVRWLSGRELTVERPPIGRYLVLYERAR